MNTLTIKVHYREDGIIDYTSTVIENDTGKFSFGKNLQRRELSSDSMKDLLSQDFKKYIDNFQLLSKVRSEMFDVLEVKRHKDNSISRLRIYMENCFYLLNGCVYAETTDVGNGILIHDGKEYRVTATETINNGKLKPK